MCVKLAWNSQLGFQFYLSIHTVRGLRIGAQRRRAKKKESIKCKIGKVTKLNRFIAEEAKTVKTSVVT